MSSSYLIIGGNPKGRPTEVFDIYNTKMSCTFEDDDRIVGNHGYLSTDGYPVACAGYLSRPECLQFLENGTWIQNEEIILSNYRGSSGSTKLDNFRFWITGGGYYNIYLSTSEILIDNEIIEEGPDLPLRMGGHCQVMLNSSYIFFIGGKTTNQIDLDRTWSYSWNSKQWTDQPNLMEVRSFHSCGIYRGEYLVVTAGTNGVNELVTTELLKLSQSPWKWTQGPELEKAKSYCQIIQDDNGEIYVSGGSYNTFYSTKMVEKFTIDKWIKLERVTLKRSSSTVIQLPQFLVDRFCN